MTQPSAAAYATWLGLREDADAAARATEPLDLLAAALPAPPLVIADLGAGTGSMVRWLAGRLPGPQRWILYDRDPGLLARAVTGLPRTAADGAPVTAVTEHGEIAGLRAGDLAGTSLVTASALLDLLTADEMGGLAAACAGAGCPVLLALTVVGRVDLTPADPLDGELAAAFNDHQRGIADGCRRLGPDAADAAAAAFTRLGATVHRRPSPWRLGPERAALTERWLRDWVAAAVEQRPGLAPRAEPYLRQRLAACGDGRLRVMVGHTDLLVLPGSR